MQPVRDGLLFGATALAGAVNAVAGGGTLMSFPAALAWGLPSPVANATNALALCPGALASAWAYRRDRHLGFNSVLYTLAFAWEVKQTLHHLSACESREVASAVSKPAA